MASYADQISRGLNQTAQGVGPTSRTSTGGSYADQINSGLGRGEQRKQTVDDLLSEENWPRVAAYMEDRVGMSEADHSREEIKDAFVNAMRGFNSGNSIDVLGEMNYLFRGEGNELDTRRGVASDAYDVWDGLGGAFSGTTVGQKLDAVGDYARSIILDPVNAVSLGFGKLGAATATRSSTAALKELARAAGEAAAKGATGKVAKQAARDQAVNRVMRSGFQQLGTEAGKSAGRRAVIGDIAGTAAFDTVAAVAADAGIQSVDRTVGRQEGYNATQGAISALGGVAGAGLAGGLIATRGWGNLASSGQAVRGGERAHRAMLKELEDAKKAAAVVKENVPNARQGFAEIVTPLREAVERGRFLDEEDTKTAVEFSAEVNQEFMGGLNRMLRGGGINIEVMDSLNGQRRAAWYIDTITDPSFPNELYDEIQAAFRSTVKAAQPDIKKKDMNLEEWLDLNAKEASQAGSTLAAQRAMFGRAKKRAMDEGVPDPDGNPMAVVMNELGEAPKKQGWWGEVMSGVQHNFIRMLVTHPGTTYLNVVGWSNATAMTSLTDIFRGTLYGGYSVAKNLVGDNVGAAAYRKKAGQMWSLQQQKFRNLLDYQATKDEALTYLTYRPEAQKAMFRYMAGGIEQGDLMDDLAKLAGDKTTKSKTTQAIDMLQVANGVSAQDMLTKTQEFMYALDKGLRLKYGQTYNEFMARDDIYELMRPTRKGEKPSAKYKEFMAIEAQAVEEALGNVFARKLGEKNNGAIRWAADMLESARNVPVVGALIPFGQFFNNSVAFMADHVGLSFVMKPFMGNKKSGMELALKAAAGWTTILWAAEKEAANLEEGLAWYEERDADGKIVNRLYDFPVSFYKMIGRMGAHMKRDGAVPKPLYEEFLKTFGPESVTRGIGDAAEEIRKASVDIFSGEGDAENFKDLFQTSAGMYGSGFTRFIEPVNAALALAEGEDYVEPTRAVGDKGWNNSIRYTDRILDNIIGLENMPFDASGYEVENFNALNDRDAGANPNRQMGIRESVPNSSIGKLFNDIGRAQWQTGLRIENPAMKEVWEKHIFPLLEFQADQIMENGNWDEMSLSRKEIALNDMLNLAKGQLKDSFAATSGDDRAKAGLVVQISNRKGQGRESFDNILAIFEVDESTLDTLTESQLNLILDAMKSAQANERAERKERIGQ